VQVKEKEIRQCKSTKLNAYFGYGRHGSCHERHFDGAQEVLGNSSGVARRGWGRAALR